MARYLLTSTQFEGEIELQFSADGDLVGYQNRATLTDIQKKWIAYSLPMRIEHVRQVLGASQTARLFEIPEDLSFARFWCDYDYKVGNKARAQKLYDELSDADKMLALRRIAIYDDFVKIKKIGKVYPETYLSQRRFENDFTICK